MNIKISFIKIWMAMVNIISDLICSVKIKMFLKDGFKFLLAPPTKIILLINNQQTTSSDLIFLLLDAS